MPDPQEPRTGGVSERWEATLYEYSDEYEVEAGHVDAHTLTNGNARNGWFIPLAEAEALIDPNDPAVREVVIEALCSASAWDGTTRDKADAVIAALRGDS